MGFQIGDLVKFLGNTNDDRNGVGWIGGEMDKHIGGIYTISRVSSEGHWYELDGVGDTYWYDEEWLMPVSILDDASHERLDDFFSEFAHG